MGISQHASSVVYASWLHAIKQPQHHTLNMGWENEAPRTVRSRVKDAARFQNIG